MLETLSDGAYRAALEALPTGAYVVDRERRILLWSAGAEELTGYLRQEVIGRPCADDLLMHCDESNTVLCGQGCPLQQTLCDGRSRTADLFLLHKDGLRIPVTVHAAALRNEHGSIVGAIECFERRLVLPASDPRLHQPRQDSTMDPDTGLPDHTATEASLGSYLEAYRTSPVPFGALLLEPDGLEHLRHTAGRVAVDAVLRATGNTLAANLGPADMVGRWFGDKFLAVVTGCTETVLVQVADRLNRVVQMERVPWWGEQLKVTLSIGGTVVQTADTVPILIARAEAAWEKQKQESSGGTSSVGQTA